MQIFFSERTVFKRLELGEDIKSIDDTLVGTSLKPKVCLQASSMEPEASYALRANSHQY